MSSVPSAVTGGGDPATFVLVAPPPQAARTMAASTSIDKSILNFLILLSLLFYLWNQGALSKTNVTLNEH
jgi:hypothetical protein